MAGVPPRFLEARPEDFSAALPKMNRDGLVIRGPLGRGKSHLAAALLVDLIPVHGIGANEYGSVELSTKWIDGREYTKEFRRLLRVGADAEAWAGEIAHQRLVVVDDIGMEYDTEFFWSLYCDLISTRLNYLLPTIITTNLTFDELEQKDRRFGGRLSGMAIFEFTKDDKDWRAASA